MELIFIRHGRPKIVAGDNDPVLSDSAKVQAKHVGNWLLRENIERVVSSPLRRAFETAEPTSRILGLELEVIEGLAEVGRSGPGYRGIEELRKDPVVWAKFMEDPISFFGSDPVTFKRGVLDAVGSLFDNRLEGKVAVFTHGVPINIVLSHALGLKRVSHFLPHYSSLTRISGLSLDGISIVSVNETAHLVDSQEAPISPFDQKPAHISSDDPRVDARGTTTSNPQSGIGR
jgi:broad specificity phosphatase PhoE